MALTPTRPGRESLCRAAHHDGAVVAPDHAPHQGITMKNVTRTARRFAGTGAVLLLTSMGAAAMAPAARASGSGTACPTNRLCFYFNSSSVGLADFTYSDSGLGNEPFTDGPSGRSGWGVVVNNNAASVKNRTGEWVTMYDNSGCTTGGGWAAIAPGTNFNLVDLGLKNQVSSIYVPGSGCVSRDQRNQ